MDKNTVQAEREAFEAWARTAELDTKFPDLSRYGEAYWQRRTETAWKSWQARAALPAAELSDGDIIYIFETHCGWPNAKYPLAEKDVILFSRALLASSTVQPTTDDMWATLRKETAQQIRNQAVAPAYAAWLDRQAALGIEAHGGNEIWNAATMAALVDPVQPIAENELLQEAGQIMDALMLKMAYKFDRNAEFAAVASWKMKAQGIDPVISVTEALSSAISAAAQQQSETASSAEKRHIEEIIAMLDPVNAAKHIAALRSLLRPAAQEAEKPQRMLNSAREHGMDLGDNPVAYEFINPKTGHAIVDYTRWTHAGHLTEADGYEARPLQYVQEAAREQPPGERK